MKLLFLHHFTKLFTFSSIFLRASLVAQMVKNPPAMQEPRETQVRSLGWEDPLEKGMATPVFLPGESPWTEKSGRLQPIGLQRAEHG